MKHLVKKRYCVPRPRLILNPTNVQNNGANRTNCDISSTRSAVKQLNFGDLGVSGRSTQITSEINRNYSFESNAHSKEPVLAEKNLGSIASSYLNASSLISNFTTKSKDTHSPASDGVQSENGMSPQYDAERLEQIRLDKKLLAVLQRMERMQERINCLELKFQNMNAYIPAGTSTTENVIQPPEPIAKEWHKNISHDFREHVLKAFVKAVHPWFPIDDDRIRVALDNFARKVEKEYFEAANSQSEYYHLIGTKYKSLQKQMAERIEKRKALLQNSPAKQMKQN